MPDRKSLRERLLGIQGLLAAEAPAATHDEAFGMIARVVNVYEEEHSGISYDPDRARLASDGRIYPPRPDSEKPTGIEGLRCYRTRGHRVYIRNNGAILFENLRTDTVDFSKAGADGEEILKWRP